MFSLADMLLLKVAFGVGRYHAGSSHFLTCAKMGKGKDCAPSQVTRIEEDPSHTVFSCSTAPSPLRTFPTLYSSQCSMLAAQGQILNLLLRNSNGYVYRANIL